MKSQTKLTAWGKLPFNMHERQLLLVAFDLFSIAASAAIAIFIACNFLYIAGYYQEVFGKLYLLAGVVVATNIFTGSYRSLWRYAGLEEMMRIILGTAIIGLAGKLVFVTFNVYSPPTFMLTFGGIFAGFMVMSRFSYRLLRRFHQQATMHRSAQSRVLIIGAGAVGNVILKEMMDNPRISKVPIVFVDDDPGRQKMSMSGVPVAGSTKNLEKICAEYRIDEIIIAIPSAKKSELTEIVNRCKNTKCHVSIIPGYDEVLDGKIGLNALRDVDIKDLLGRDEIETDLTAIGGYVTNEVVLVTGGGGSIGSELCRQIARFSPKCLLILDIYENNAYDLQNELKRHNKELCMEVLIASVRDKDRMRQIFETYKPKVVFHAAAHKHVPLMEDSPMEAIKNNVFGTYNVAQMAHEYGIRKFVLISTDKAVNPTNIMGSSKRIAERVIKAFDSMSKTEFVAVRFGNVLGSNGSVIPLFKKQIKEGGPVTVTDKEMIRYFMTIPEAVRLVLQAGALARGGEVFVLDMGEPVKIITLAEDLIRLSGFEPYHEIPIIFTGLRPGEKLYEELLMAEEGLLDTIHKKIFIGKQTPESFDVLGEDLDKLHNAANDDERKTLIQLVRKLVPTYTGKPEQGIKENLDFPKEMTVEVITEESN